MHHLQQYVSSDDDDSLTSGGNNLEDITSHLKPLDHVKSIIVLQNKMQVCAAPDVDPTVSMKCNCFN